MRNNFTSTYLSKVSRNLRKSVLYIISKMYLCNINDVEAVLPFFSHIYSNARSVKTTATTTAADVWMNNGSQPTPGSSLPEKENWGCREKKPLGEEKKGFAFFMLSDHVDY